ncbi:DUF4873 domain-containing protein [Nocardia nova]|uniref:DUF4873 domain-containing protein n=1 Tax=Nocardia nova TaxID=37330 RepID=UPI000CEA33AB|nr:DUF4873 domain-containing protein [Nocardia nova]
MRQPDADYLGPAVVVLDDREFAVRVRLRGHRQPIDGIYRWYGRVDPDAALDAAAGNRKQRVTLRTTEGAANAILGDRDFWGRLRLVGHSAPPYRISTADDLDARMTR